MKRFSEKAITGVIIIIANLFILFLLYLGWFFWKFVLELFSIRFSGLLYTGFVIFCVLFLICYELIKFRSNSNAKKNSLQS